MWVLKTEQKSNEKIETLLHIIRIRNVYSIDFESFAKLRFCKYAFNGVPYIYTSEFASVSELVY